MLLINYNWFDDDDLEQINEAAWLINFIFCKQFPDRKQPMEMLEKDEQFRSINQIVIQTHNTIDRRAQERLLGGVRETITILDE